MVGMQSTYRSPKTDAGKGRPRPISLSDFFLSRARPDAVGTRGDVFQLTVRHDASRLPLGDAVAVAGYRVFPKVALPVIFAK